MRSITLKRRTSRRSSRVGAALDRFLQFEHPDALRSAATWRGQLDAPLPHHGVGIDQVVKDLVEHVIPNGLAVPKPGFTSFITTGATSAAALATTAASIASPQRYGLTAFNLLEDLSLRWLASMCQVGHMQGVYSSGGSVANLLALGAARQSAFERVGHDAGACGVHRPVHVYASAETHHTVQRAAGVLGIGPGWSAPSACDSQGRMRVDALRAAIAADRQAGILPMAIVANAGTTNTGAIDPLRPIGDVARENGIWLHVDGAYGLPGILDDRIRHLYGMGQLADSVIVDPQVAGCRGVAATFVRDRQLLYRAFTTARRTTWRARLRRRWGRRRGSSTRWTTSASPYDDYGVELSAPCRGVGTCGR